MRRAFLQSVLIFLAFLIPASALWWRLRGDDRAVPEVALERGEVPAQSPAADPLQATAVPARPPDPHAWEEGLGAQAGRETALVALRTIADELRALDREDALERILGYLESDRDQETGLPFALGRDGELRSAPMLRVWLLDQLGQLDPSVAAAVARQALEAPKHSADEWAIHLRNLAWGEPVEAVRGRLIGKTVEMLEHEPWRSHPTSGFQHAFDLLVYSRATGEVPRLLEMIPPGQPRTLQHPASLALEELVARFPAESLQEISHALARLAERPRTRAGLFARADPASAGQQELLDHYFLHAQLGAEERDYFLRMMPNLNVSISRNLLTEPRAPTREEIVEKRQSTIALFDRWLLDPRFGEWNEAIAAARGRLAEVE